MRSGPTALDSRSHSNGLGHPGGHQVVQLRARALAASHRIPHSMRHQLQRSRQLDPGPWRQAAAPGWRYSGPGHPAIEIAIYPDIIRLATRCLRAHDTTRGAAP